MSNLIMEFIEDDWDIRSFLWNNTDLKDGRERMKYVVIQGKTWKLMHLNKFPAHHFFSFFFSLSFPEIKCRKYSSCWEVLLSWVLVN